MRRYILTGTPGCGKTSIIRALETKGYFVVHEAATDIIAQAGPGSRPWEHPSFIDQIIALQKQRQIQSPQGQFYDRSPICTYALAMYLKFEPSDELMREIERIQADHLYEKKVFFIENLGFVEPTDARKITYDDSLVFERIHEKAYKEFGYECIMVPHASVDERVGLILNNID